MVRKVLESVEALKRESLLVHQISTVNQYNDARGHTQAIISFDRMHYPNRLDPALVMWASECALAYQKRSLEIQLAKRDRKAARETKKQCQSQLLQARNDYWQQEEQLLDNLSVHDLSQLGKFWRIKFAEYYARRKASLAGKTEPAKTETSTTYSRIERLFIMPSKKSNNVASGDPNARIEDVGPEKAHDFLERGGDFNRRYSERHVARLATKMRNGTWLFNGDSLKFNGKNYWTASTG
jgi:vancomycin resistance protein YoaR